MEPHAPLDETAGRSIARPKLAARGLKKTATLAGVAGLDRRHIERGVGVRRHGLRFRTGASGIGHATTPALSRAAGWAVIANAGIGPRAEEVASAGIEFALIAPAAGGHGNLHHPARLSHRTGEGDGALIDGIKDALGGVAGLRNLGIPRAQIFAVGRIDGPLPGTGEDLERAAPPAESTARTDEPKCCEVPPWPASLRYSTLFGAGPPRAPAPPFWDARARTPGSRRTPPAPP